MTAFTARAEIATATFTPGADSRVAKARPSTNYGSAKALRVDGGSDPDIRSYFKFRVADLAGDVETAKLRAYVTSNNSSNGPAVYGTANTWTEKGITWKTRPETIGPPSDDLGPVGSLTWVEWDVSALVKGEGTYSFVLIGNSRDGVDMRSRETRSPPRLVVTTAGDSEPPADVPPADTIPPTPPTSLVATAATESSISIGWTASSDDVGVAGYTVYRDGAVVGSTSQTDYTVAALGCGATYSLAVEAYDAAGKVSELSTLTAATLACPPPAPVFCDKVAAPDGSDSASGTLSSPFGTAQTLADSLAPGQTGCLRAGAYSIDSGYVLDLENGGYTIRSYPGESAKLIGNIQVAKSAAGVVLSQLDIEGTGGSNTVKVYAADVVVEDSTITNLGRGNSCMILGSNSGYGQAARVIVRRNLFHDCGSAAHDNKDHGIYAQNVLDGEIVGNIFWNSAAYAIQLYPNAQRTRFAHNVVDGDLPSVRGGVLFGGDSAYASSDNIVEHNVIAYAVTYNITSTWSGAAGSGNIARDNCLWAGRAGNIDASDGGFTANAITVADPLFVNRPNRDYRLGTESKCKEVVAYDAAARIREAGS